MSIPFVDLKTQYHSIRAEIAEAFDEILENTAFIGGKAVADFEERFAEYTGSKHCIGVSSGTSALHVALTACGIGAGDEVITVPNTFIATTEAISSAGAKFKLVDVEPVGFNMNPELIEAAITPNTKAIMPVHLYGQPADMDPIGAIAEKHGLQVIADSAQAHGSMYKGKKVGELARVSCFSFYPGKNLGAYGDAGAIVTDDADVADLARRIIDHGRTDKYGHAVEGYNHRLDALQAAVLGVKLGHIENWTDGRRRAAATYRKLLADLPIEVCEELPDRKHVYHLFSVFHEERDRLREFLGTKGIAAGVHYPVPLHLQGAYASAGMGEGTFPVSEQLASRQLSLPMFPELTDEQAAEVAAALEEALS